jgi:uncharacterized membrane protein YoaK (UPF0700 family)
MTADDEENGRWPATARDYRVVLLTVTSGAVNAVSFLALGKVFSSVITGNLVLLGVSATSHAPNEALHAGVAIAGYIVGILIGAPLAARYSHQVDTWPASVKVTLAAELFVLAGFSAGWELTHGRPHDGSQLTLLVVLAATMGIQSSAVRRLGQMSSTYLTSTLLGVLAGLLTGSRPEGLVRSIGVLVGVVAGALIGGVLAESAPAWLPLALLLPLGAVVAGPVAVSWRHRPK